MGPVTDSLYSQRLIAATERERHIARAERLAHLRNPDLIISKPARGKSSAQRRLLRRLAAAH